MRRKIFIRLLPLSVLSYVILLPALFVSIGANEVGIIFHEHQGVLQDRVMEEGFRSKSIFEKITKISTSNRDTFMEVHAQSSDSASALFEISITYRIERQNAGKFFSVTNDKNIANSQISSVIRESLQSVTTKYDIFEIMGTELDLVRSEVSIALEKNLNDRFHITLISLSIDDVDAKNQVEQIIQEKAEAEQRIQIAKREQERAIIDAETEKIKAENQAEIEILKATASAEAQETLNKVAVNAIQSMYITQFKTKLDVDGNLVVDEELKTMFEDSIDINTGIGVGGFLSIQEIGEIVIKQLYFDVLDGKLPSVITDGNGNIIISPFN